MGATMGFLIGEISIAVTFFCFCFKSNFKRRLF